MKKPKSTPPLAEEWDISEGMGIIPSDVSLTQNIGCVGGKSKKAENEASKPKKSN